MNRFKDNWIDMQKNKNSLRYYSDYFTFLALLFIIILIYAREGFEITLLSRSLVNGYGADISVPKNIYYLRQYLYKEPNIREITLCDEIKNNEPLKQQIYENIYPVKISLNSSNLLCINDNNITNNKFKSCKLKKKLEDISLYECS